ncbi:CHAT domain-containing protein [Pseudomonas sp. GD03842]|uniref:CHAT domain-containing protein n=1 Tax=Pseudomonas sp. GD03842 TaxID=2975385 RepID=UPI002449E7AE|nr:CHAT domain-containing protein [Pseudomonas sp. GD03842]MDH0748868.1 CHAT domain-containing protein [Pseudomonas sp. GD03842]
MRTVRAGSSPTELDVTFHLPADILLEVHGGVASPAPPLTQRNATVPSQWQVDALHEALSDAGFEVRSDVALSGDVQARDQRNLGDHIRVDVDLNPDELAVVLLEGEGGVFAWQQPDPVVNPQTRSGAKSTRTFTLTPLDPGEAQPLRRGPLTDWVIGTLIKPIRVLVLRFVAGQTVNAIVSHIESGNRTGLVLLEGMDPAKWVPMGKTLPTRGRGGTLQVLLLIHGTFSSTSGSFGALTAHESGREFLSQAYQKYDAVIGFDHKTLAEDVETNAQAMALVLGGLPRGTIVDSVAFSRGGLVWRVWARELLPRSSPDILLRNTVFVGCTNAGTHLAEPANWHDLIDFYTNVVMAGARAVGAITGSVLLTPLVSLAIKTLGEFMQMLAQVAIDERKVPGLASMEPSGATVRRLNGVEDPSQTATYRAITANFEPDRFDVGNGMTRALAEFLADRLTDRLWKNEDNDLVVDTASMTTFGEGTTLPKTSVFAYANKDLIYHTVYFAQARTCEQLSNWLGMSQGLTHTLRDAATPLELDHAFFESPVLADAVADIEDQSPVHRGGAFGDWDLSPNDIDTLGEAPAPAPGMAPPQGQEAPTTCYVNASLPESPVLGETAELEVTLSLEDIAKDAGKTHVSDIVAVKPDVFLHVKIRPRTNCRIEGPDNETIAPPGKGSPQTLSFGLKGMAVGPAEVWVDVLQGARRLTRMILQPVFVSKGNLSVLSVVDSAQEDPPMVDLRILEEGVPDRWRLRFIARCDDLEINHEFVTQDFTSKKEAYIGTLYKKLENCWAVAGEVFEQLMQSVRAEGVQMFNELFPLELRRLIWQHRAAIGSFQVVANEPSIPWEVVHVVDPDKPTPLSGGVFLAELGLTRWMSNVGIAPSKLRLRTGKAAYCIPRYHDTKLNLANVEQEATLLGELFGAVSIGDEIAPVLSALARAKGEDFDALHFACHGSTDYQQVWNAGLLLNVAGSDKTALLSVASVQTYANLALDGYRPLVFLNACQSGVTGKTLSGAGGLAQAFVQRGAGLFVGTLWSIGDRPALGFASQFYGQLKTGQNVSHALRAAREQARRDLDTSWLAYTVYGHPYARLSS